MHRNTLVYYYVIFNSKWEINISLNRNYRWVVVAELFVRNEANVPSRIVEYSFEEIEACFRSVYSENRSEYLFNHETKKMQIRDI